jgi:ParB-like chromosome segregation protein Spo0J
LIIERIAIEQIQRAAYNPRKPLRPGDPACDRLRKAVNAFGMVEPLVWNKRSGNLVGGHQRLSVLEERGDKEVDVSVVDLTDREEKVLNLALNKHAGEWEFSTLADILQELDAGDIDIELTGFSAIELENMMTASASPAAFRELDETLPTDHQCPKCGYRFSGEKRQQKP